MAKMTSMKAVCISGLPDNQILTGYRSVLSSIGLSSPFISGIIIFLFSGGWFMYLTSRPLQRHPAFTCLRYCYHLLIIDLFWMTRLTSDF